MADLTTNLTSQKPLKFTFVPSGTSLPEGSTDGSITGVGTLVFDEARKIIKVRGVEYGYDSTTAGADTLKLKTALDALVNAGLVTKEGNVYSADQLVDSLIGGTGVDASIAELISNFYAQFKLAVTGIEADITTINTNITNLETDILTGVQKAKDFAATGIQDAKELAATGVYEAKALAATGVYEAKALAASGIQEAKNLANTKVNSITGETGDSALIGASTGENHDVTLSATQKLQTAVGMAESAVQTVVTNGITYTKSNGVASGVIGGADILVGVPSGVTGAYYGANTIAFAIDNLKKLIDSINGEGDDSLTKKLQQLDEIYAELTASDTGDEANLKSIIDALRQLKIQTTEFYGIDENSIGTESKRIALQTSLENLYNKIATGVYEAKAYAATGIQGAKELAATGIYEAKALAATGVYEAKGLAGAAQTGVQEAKEYAYTGISANVTGIQEVKDFAATGIQGARDFASSGIQEAKGLAGAAQTGVQQAKDIAASGISANVTGIQEAKNLATAAQSAADAAQRAADSVISWNVIGASE